MEDMTPGQKRLNEALVQIGWELRSCGCGYYAVMNHKGERTGWRASSETLETTCKELFGKKASEHGDSGSIFFQYDEVEFQFQQNLTVLAISPKDGGKGGGPHISFYNFDKDKAGG